MECLPWMLWMFTYSLSSALAQDSHPHLFFSISQQQNRTTIFCLRQDKQNKPVKRAQINAKPMWILTTKGSLPLFSFLFESLFRSLHPSHLYPCLHHCPVVSCLSSPFRLLFLLLQCFHWPSEVPVGFACLTPAVAACVQTDCHSAVPTRPDKNPADPKCCSDCHILKNTGISHAKYQTVIFAVLQNFLMHVWWSRERRGVNCNCL